jgi:putative cardiolipin synthase
LAIGVGFGAQNIIKNLISGVIILFERKVRVGDIVTIDGVSGTVTSVDLRATTVRGFDGIEAIVPNSNLLENRVSNWSYGDPTVRRAIVLGRLVAEATRDAASGQSALLLLAAGEDALAARLALIEKARRSVDLQYYIFRPDSSGMALAAALRQAAARGVRVRLLLDDWGTRPDDLALQGLAADPRFEVRLFNPLAHPRAPLLSLLLDFERGQRRMHNKLMVVDGRAAITGGRNVGDEYFERRREFAFADVDVLAFGPVVSAMAAGFDLYWNDVATAAVMPPAQANDQAALLAGTTHRPAEWQPDSVERLGSASLRRFVGRATAVQDLPGKVDPSRPQERTVLGHEIAAVMGEVRSELLIVSPYFVPGDGGVDQLRALAERGVRVTVVTNSLVATDVPAVHGGYARYRAALLRAGVALYEIRADAVGRQPTRTRAGSSRVSLHAKLMVVDRTKSFVGSMNIDPRSLRLNTENGVVVDSTALATELVQGVERDLTRDAWRVHLDGSSLRWTGRQGDADVTLDREPQAGLWLRLKTMLMSWLPIETLL